MEAGWYPDPDSSDSAPRRYWNGSEWGVPRPEDRRLALDSRIEHWFKHGYRVESRSDHQAILVRGKRPNHVLHLLLSILTVGVWFLFVWLPVMVFGGEKRRLVSVDSEGRAVES